MLLLKTGLRYGMISSKLSEKSKKKNRLYGKQLCVILKLGTCSCMQKFGKDTSEVGTNVCWSGEEEGRGSIFINFPLELFCFKIQISE